MKHFILTSILAFIFALLPANASATDIRTLVVTTTPQMHCERCEKKIKGNLKFIKGIQRIVTNVEEQTVTITYDADKTTPEAILRAFEKFKYKASIVSNDEQATHGPNSATKPKK